MSLDAQRCGRNFWKLLQVVPEVWRIKNHAKSHVAGLMDLNVDVIERSSGYLRIALSHYWLHPCGDLIPDPDIEIAVFLTDCLAEALVVNNSFTYSEAYPYEGEPPNFIVHQCINEYLEHWLDVLAAQGHVVSGGNFSGDADEQACSNCIHHERINA
jgi:uncharacterized protein YqiB (DUF1249 family)